MVKKAAPKVEKNKYSPEELQEFKELILEKIAKAEKDLEMLQQAVAGNENEASDTAPTFKTLEEGSNVLLKEENQKLAARHHDRRGQGGKQTPLSVPSHHHYMTRGAAMQLPLIVYISPFKSAPSPAAPARWHGLRWQPRCRCG